MEMILPYSFFIATICLFSFMLLVESKNFIERALEIREKYIVEKVASACFLYRLTGVGQKINADVGFDGKIFSKKMPHIKSDCYSSVSIENGFIVFGG
ncbi:MAG: hypothetical protein QW097_01710 [archaeon]